MGGYGRGEGAAVILLKRLSSALKDGDNVRAVILNTGLNQDGRTSGIALPNQEAQQSLIRSVYRGCNRNPSDVAYVEAHGTGTVVGDLAETKGIAGVFCGNERKDNLLIGSVKGNIGHLESASGIAGVVKTILALERGRIPPSINLEVVRDGLDLDEKGIKVSLRTVTVVLRYC
jgi:acyl transferase domain-containing protein